MPRLTIALLAVAVLAVAAPAQEYEGGGPLAGVKLPLFPTQHGEPPGYPGCVPALADEAAKTVPPERLSAIDAVNFTPQGLAPEMQLYPGSVEHWRDGMFKYAPVRSEFDRQSLLKNFVAPLIPGASPQQVEQYSEPVCWMAHYGRPILNTGLVNAPVPVVRCKAGSPALRLDLGTLDRGLYAVRVIGAVETKELRPFRKALFLRLRVNDGPQGEVSDYRKRVYYNDQFYCVGMFFFHAPDQRAFRAELSVDAGSEVDLLAHNVTLDNALAGCEWKPLKTKRTLTDPKALVDKEFTNRFGKRAPLAESERLARDAAIWNAYPPVNAQPGGHDDLSGVTDGAAGKTLAEIDGEFGNWAPGPLTQAWNDWNDRLGVFPEDLSKINQLVVNNKLKLVYTMQDFAAHKPLPDPFPYKDDGAALTTSDPAAPDKGQVFRPIAQAVERRMIGWETYLKSGDNLLRSVHDPSYARDSAVALCRFAYEFPTLEIENTVPWIVRDPGPNGWDPRRFIQRAEGPDYGNFIRFLEPIYAYDSLFDYIKGNEDLARSIHRFVPWVETSRDVQTLLDVYLVQTMAKRVLRYQYFGDGHQPTRIAELATMVADPAVTDPWMDWLFSRTFYYPLPLEGIQDVMICGNDREGPAYLGSSSYCEGEGAAGDAATLMQYVATGGDPKYDMSDFKRYPKPLAHCYWILNSIIGGRDFIRIGDVAGPDKRPGRTLGDGAMKEACERGWKWSADPKFAWALKNIFKAQFDTAAEEQRVDAAAALATRAPWLDNRSRAVDNWVGVLETGLQHDDYRFRRSVYVRAGTGFGHDHADAMDLQVFEHGLPMTVDGGQRSGYSSPRDSTTRVHNTVEVNGANNGNRAWVSAISDAEGSRYMSVDGIPPADAHLFRRQVALIDVDEGTGSQPLSVEQQSDSDLLPKDVVTGNSYVFDVFRVSGGDTHTYCFHGPVCEAFDANLPDRKPIEQGSPEDQKYLGIFGLAPEAKFVSPAPKDLVSTWQMQRVATDKNKCGSEQFMMGKLFDPQSPPKFTRLMLFGVGDAKAYLADSVCRQWTYDIKCLMVQRKSTGPLESAFTALIEPYVGKPFIASSRELNIPDNEADAQRAAAIEVKTVNGHTDICFADGRPEKVRTVSGAGFQPAQPAADQPIRISGEFAYYSSDADGLREATLSGGTLLSTPTVKLQVAQRERTGKVVQVDYAEKTLRIDHAWPAGDREQIFEIGALDGQGYTTSYTAKSVRPQGNDQSVITVTRGADLCRSRVVEVNEQTRTVRCALGAFAATKRMVAANDAGTKFWRADALPNKEFRLDGPVTEKDFAPQGALRLWEYGVGDRVRRSTFVSLRRVAGDEYELTADVDVEVGLDGGPPRKVTAAELAAGNGAVRIRR